MSISDLRVTVRAGKSVNLLDDKHYKLKYEDIVKSAVSGSLFTKRDTLKVSDKPPVIPVMPGKQEAVLPFQSRIKIDALRVEAKKFADLGDLDDEEQRKAEEKYALENIDVIASDDVPVNAKDEKYKNIPQGKFDKIEDFHEYMNDDEDEE
jgi:hypothetical protein